MPFRYKSQFFETDWTTGKPSLSAQGQAAIDEEIKRIERRNAGAGGPEHVPSSGTSVGAPEGATTTTTA